MPCAYRWARGGCGCIRQLLTENFLIALAGGVLGVALASIPLRMVNVMMSKILQQGEMSPLRIDERVILFSASVALASLILSGVWPALHATRQGLNVAMHGGISLHPRRLWGRNVAVAGQVTIAFVLLTATGIIFLWLHYAQKAITDSAFDSGNTIAITFDPLVKRFHTDEAKHFTKLWATGLYRYGHECDHVRLCCKPDIDSS